jgi:hypothetical protein
MMIKFTSHVFVGFAYIPLLCKCKISRYYTIAFLMMEKMKISEIAGY